MFDTLLIANRGEIACRIARTARRLGLRSVAVYSDADREALHVSLCDAAVRIGPAAAAKSYLDAAAIVAAAKKTGAQAIHPGYGFLSESLALIEACEAEGLVFVGPSRQAIRRMGSKIESKRIATAHDVPVVPGYHGDEQDADKLGDIAASIGFPVLIKASAGGGGKGMRVVHSAAEFGAALATVRSEAKASFADERVLLERYLAEPRHLEVQLLGDRHGNLVHLFERECSIQRHHQKVIEEAPAAHLQPSEREALYRYALAIGRAIGYDSTGTVEFIHDAKTAETFFLEMNTRLQVEHPVTEATVGIDLVEWQLRVAAGEALSFRQENLQRRGWAIEARVCAEDPAANFAPEIGAIAGYCEPQGEGVRVDSGVRAASQITPNYDSMLAKVIAAGETRDEAARRLLRALDDYELLGVRTNLQFLADLVRHPSFAAPLTTHYIDRAFPAGWQADEALEALPIAAVACALAAHRTDGSSPWRSLGAWRIIGDAAPCAMLVLLEDNARHWHEIEVQEIGGRWRVKAGEDVVECHASLAGERLQFTRDGFSAVFRFQQVDDNGREYVWLAGPLGTHVWRRGDRWLRALAGTTSAEAGNALRAPMPGLVTAVPAVLASRVCAGDPLVVIEAMKMVHTLVAPIDGTIAELRCRAGDAVRGGDLLVKLLADEATHPGDLA